MAAKLLHSLTDDNPDLQKQIGCMTGIFQLFDRDHIISSRRITSHSPKRLPSGISPFKYSIESNGVYHPSTAEDQKDANKTINEKQRVSTESSRASFSSSSRSSSFSSLDCNRAAQPEPLSFDRIIFPETPSRDPAMSQSSASPQFGRQSLDLRDVVKDSMYREARGLSVKTTTKGQSVDQIAKYKDSPKPLQFSASGDGSCSMGFNGKQNFPSDIKESLRVLSKLQESPSYFNESRDSKDESRFSVTKDAPRFSYDGRELNWLSFESRDNYKSTLKLKERPRLSLDGREDSMRSLNSDSKSNFLVRNSQGDGGNSNDRMPVLQQISGIQGGQQISGIQARPPSVVAKLMGLETLPDAALANDSRIGLIKRNPVEDSDPFLRTLKSSDPCQPIQISSSPRSLSREPASPRWRKPESAIKPISRFPVEPAPWKQVDGTQASQRPAFRHPKPPTRASNSFPSVYSEIDKRLKDFEFSQAGKDLRALKQILEAMQAKGLLESSREEHDSDFRSQRDHQPRYSSLHVSGRSVKLQKSQNDHVGNSKSKGANSLRSFDPIVIMKPAKLVEKSGIPASSVIPIDRLSDLPKHRGRYSADGRKSSVNNQTKKEHTSKTSFNENAVNSTGSKRTNNRTLKSTQIASLSLQLPKESTTSALKSSGSVSPRLQQKKLELEKRSRPPISPDSSKSRRQPSKQQQESGSPSAKRRPKSVNLRQSDDQLSEISSDARNLNNPENDISVQSDGSIFSDSGIEIEVTSSEHCAETNGSRSPSVKAAKNSSSTLVQKRLAPRISEDAPAAEFPSVAPEHPSPVSVLDDTMYGEDAASPVKQISDAFKDDGTMNSNESCNRDQSDSVENLMPNSTGSSLQSKVSRKKLADIEHLVQKLRRLNSSHNEAQTDYIASLCENTNTDHRYISEILLASGLLLRDLDSSLATFQLHSSGHPINPELFLVLEQTKASSQHKEECGIGNVVHVNKPDSEKQHRKLLFDAVNEILVLKLVSEKASPEPWMKPCKLTRKSLNAQKLLKELCSEIEHLRANKFEHGLEDEDDSLKSIVREDVMRWSGSWTDLHDEISGIGLDVERLIFKDLVNEVVHGEAAGRQTKPGRRCRKLFA